MHRRPLGNGRRLALIGAIVLIIGCVLPWYVLGGNGGLPRQAYTAFDGTGIVSFFAALATLALIALPYAAGDRPVAIDNGFSFGLLAIAAIVGVRALPPQRRRGAGGPAAGSGLRVLDLGAGRGDHGPRRVRHLAGAAPPLTRPGAQGAGTGTACPRARSAISIPSHRW